VKQRLHKTHFPCTTFSWYHCWGCNTSRFKAWKTTLLTQLGYNIILRMHLATCSAHFADNKSTYFRLFICVNINRVTALSGKWRLKEGRKEDWRARWLLIDCLRESHRDSFNLKSRFPAPVFSQMERIIFSVATLWLLTSDLGVVPGVYYLVTSFTLFVYIVERDICFLFFLSLFFSKYGNDPWQSNYIIAVNRD
jgi:hypothetical protein